ncbi:MAG: CubicO group peptidase (beta-lactamase class C family) [Crocinitomicaceae bacterium]|jgi:CubicO group peptidase (beta-lactamase class C family)
MDNTMRQFNIFSTIILLAVSINSNAQINNNSELFNSIYKSDSLLFEEGFNNCNLALVDSIVTDDFEFYHDMNGSQDKAMFLKTFKESLCSTPNRKPIRKLVRSSMEVFPLYNEGILYGAIQKATHEFYIKEPEKDLYKTNIASFTHLWLLEGSLWKLKSSLSYDHHNPKAEYGQTFEANYPKELFVNDDDVNQLIAQHNIPSLGIGYINDGKLQQVRLYGEKYKEHPVDYNTVYKIASLTKPITAIITLKLIEKGLWNLDEPVFNYYVDEDVKDAPELKMLTTRHILSHQSGFPNWRHLIETNKLSFEFEPGAKFQYSGEGYEYLRKALEAKFKKGLEDLAEEFLFEPLNMNNTHFYWNDEIDENNYAVEHDEFGQPMEYDKYTTVNASANVLTTIQDYGTFMAHIINGVGLSDSLFQEFLTPHSNKQPGIDWGLGCQLLFDLDENGEFAVMHGGGDYGLKTIMLMLPNSKKGLLIFSNSENGMVIWRKLIEEYFGEIGEEIVRRQLN